MKKLLTAAAVLLMSTVAHAEMAFTVHSPDGKANVRSGPGTNHGLIAEIPEGTVVYSSRCIPRDDGIRGANWCLVEYQPGTDAEGWVSQAILLPRTEQRRPIYLNVEPVRPERSAGLVCDPPSMIAGGGYDANPVMRTEINYSIQQGAWHVVHIMRDGQIATRDEQYAMNDESNVGIKVLRWTGSQVRNPSYYMVGSVERINGKIVYAETQYQRNVLRFQSAALCHVAAN